MLCKYGGLGCLVGNGRVSPSHYKLRTSEEGNWGGSYKRGLICLSLSLFLSLQRFQPCCLHASIKLSGFINLLFSLGHLVSFQQRLPTSDHVRFRPQFEFLFLVRRWCPCASEGSVVVLPPCSSRHQRAARSPPFLFNPQNQDGRLVISLAGALLKVSVSRTPALIPYPA